LAADPSARHTSEEARDDRAFFLDRPKWTALAAYAASMAAIVATLAYLPVAGVVAILTFGFDVPLHNLLTFRGHVPVPLGLALWWVIAFVPAFAYSAALVLDEQ
jgi:hypothetical protein